MPKKSSKHSATNAKRREAYARKAAFDKRPVLFIDRALQGNQLIAALREAGANIQLHKDNFQDDAEDTDWLPIVGQRGWCVITRDKAIQRRPLEKRMLKKAMVGYFALSANKVDGAEQTEIILEALPAIEEIALTATKPFIARIARGGVVTLVKED